MTDRYYIYKKGPIGQIIANLIVMLVIVIPLSFFVIIGAVIFDLFTLSVDVNHLSIVTFFLTITSLVLLFIIIRAFLNISYYSLNKNSIIGYRPIGENLEIDLSKISKIVFFIDKGHQEYRLIEMNSESKITHIPYLKMKELADRLKIDFIDESTL